VRFIVIEHGFGFRPEVPFGSCGGLLSTGGSFGGAAAGGEGGEAEQAAMSAAR
jgi:hypothetical protein